MADCSGSDSEQHRSLPVVSVTYDTVPLFGGAGYVQEIILILAESPGRAPDHTSSTPRSGLICTSKVLPFAVTNCDWHRIRHSLRFWS